MLAAHPDRDSPPLVENIIEPLHGRLGTEAVEKLRAGLAMVLGIESYVALNDIYGLSPTDIAEVWRWACKAMVAQALAEAGEDASGGPGERAIAESGY